MTLKSFETSHKDTSGIMNKSLNAGLIGFGFIGEVHARAIMAANGSVRSIAGENLKDSQDAAARLGIANAVTIEDMMKDPEIDVIHICTPNIFHADIAELAIRAGKHVICEKPLAVSVAQAEHLTQLAAEFGVIATVPFVYRYYPSVREARSRISSLDEPLILLHGFYLQDWLSRETTFNWRIDPALGGPSRAFGDIGVHWCDLLEFVTGHRITRVNAQLMKVFNNRGDFKGIETEDGVTLIFTTDKGAQGSLAVSQASAGRKNKLWFSFESPTESFVFDQEMPDSLWVGGLETNQIVMRGSTTDSDDSREFSFLPAGHPQGYQDCFNRMVRDTYSAISGLDTSGLPTFQDGLRAAKLTEAVLQSAQSGNWVEIK
jgi:predicted dehydrogenase